MEFEILKCKIKPETRSGIFIDGNRRYHDITFEIKRPGAGVQKNVEIHCDVEVIKMTQPDEIETDLINEKQDNKELVQFAADCWNLAAKYESEISELRAELANKYVNETIASRNTDSEEIVPKKKEIKKRTRKK